MLHFKQASRAKANISGVPPDSCVTWGLQPTFRISAKTNAVKVWWGTTYLLFKLIVGYSPHTHTPSYIYRFSSTQIANPIFCFLDCPYKSLDQNIQTSSCLCLRRSDLQLQDLGVGGGSADLLNDTSAKRTFACRGDIVEGGQSLLLPLYLLCDEPTYRQ